MAAHNELGKKGEELAAAHLLAEGYAIRHRNWRCAHKELDIVAEKDGLLVVVEVKTRSADFWLEPEMAVNRKKIQRLVTAADAYVRLFNLDSPVRFDIITLVKDAEGYHIREHIEDAFYAPGY